MEMNVANEQSHQERDSAILVTKSSGSLVKIGDLFLDLPFALPQEEIENFPHFSIRGYTAEMREKNRMICAPFASEDTNNLEEQLPPLIVPKHRYWRCKPCISEICAGYPTKGGVVSKCRQHGLVSYGTCLNMPSDEDAAVTQSEMQQNSTMEICSLRKSCIDASPCNIKDKNCASSSNHSKEESADIREMAFTGDVNGSSNTEKQKIGEEPLTKSSPSQGEHTDKSVSLKLNNNELVGHIDQNIAGPDADDICPPSELHKCTENSSAQICLSHKKNTSEHEQAVALASDIFTNNTVDEPVRVGAVQSTITPSIQVEHNDASNDSNEISVGSIDHRHHNDDLNGLPRRKMRKVRLLNDLLSGKGSLDIDRIRKDHTSFNVMATTSSGVRLGVAPEARALHKDIGKDKQSPPTKRKYHQEDCHSLGIRGITNVSKKARSSRVISERPHLTREVSNSEADGSHRSKQNNDRLQSSWKKKTLIQVDDDQVGRTVHVDSTQMDSSNVASTACRRAETEKCFNLFKGKRPEGEKGESSMPTADYSSLGEVPNQAIHTELMRSVFSRNQLQSENDASIQVGLDLSLGRPLTSEGTATDNISKTDASFLQQKDRPGRYPHWKDKNLVGELSVLNNPSPSQSARKGLPWDLNEKIAHNTAITLEKQKCSTLFENRGSTWQRKMDFSGPSLKGKNVEVQGHSEASKTQNDQRTNKVFEQGSSDDVPMDIVELMARNQYERQHAGGEGHYLSQKTDNIIRGPVKVQGNGPIKWLRTETPGMTNIPHANATSGIAVAVDDRVATSANAINLSHSDKSHSRSSHLEGNQLQLFSAFSRNQQKLSSGMQFPVSGSNITGSRPGEGAKPVWLSQNQNMSLGLGNIQEYSIPSNNIETHSRWTETQHKGKTISDIKAEEMKMQNKSQPILSKPGRGEVYPKLRVSLDPYSNETIPAMQLLSLMHKGTSSNAALNADANRLLGKPYSPGGYHPRLGMDERGSYSNRSVFLHQHQSPGVYSAGDSSSRPSSSLYSQLSLRSQVVEESRNWAPPVQLGVGKSNNFFPSSSGLLISQNPFPGRDKQNRGKEKGQVGTSHSVKIPPRCGRIEKSTKIVDLEANSVSATASPSRANSELGPCHFNRNPAEFSTPEPGNEYTINGGDLKLLKKDFYRERSYSVNVDGRKRQRSTKVTTGKEHARRRKS